MNRENVRADSESVILRRHALVTGCAGFIGSHLTRSLLNRGYRVTGIDSLTDYYDVAAKQRNLESVPNSDYFTFEGRDVATISGQDLETVDVVFHLAAQPGVRDSWTQFDKYVERNILATKKLFDACVQRGRPRIVFASSSSVYGDQRRYPTTEMSELAPRSPYGITKQAGEAMSRTYAESFGLDIAALRFFTVYGPRQRPDMAIHRIIDAALKGRTFTLYGDGTARRDFTYVDDVVNACVEAGSAASIQGFQPLNIGGEGDISMNDLIQLVEEVSGEEISVSRTEVQRGDVSRTGADCTWAKQILNGWKPSTPIEVGIARQIESLRQWSTPLAQG